MGIYNSSRTRVQPILIELLTANAIDAAWVVRLWELVRSPESSPPPSSAGAFNADLLNVNPATGLPRAFEYPVPPPTAFLLWLILNPEQMTLTEPETFGTVADNQARTMRRELLSDDTTRRSVAQHEALNELDRLGAEGSGRKWWAFEGFTYVDCCLETDALLLFIEGKRTEPVSSSTRWFRQRSQLWRNVEAAQELARDRAFGVVVAVEKDEEQVMETARQTRDASLPHLTPAVRDDLASHLLGAITWAQIVTEFDLPTRLLRSVDPLSRPSLDELLAE
jgi:hypothetical protein